MLFLIGGENIYLSSLRLKELKEEFEKQHQGIIQIYNADELVDENEIFRDVESLSLFMQEKLIIIKRLFSGKSQLVEKVLDYIKSSKETNLIFWEDRVLDKRRSLYKFIKRKGVVEEYNKLKYPQLKSWLSRLLNGKCKYSSDCIETLILKVGDDQMLLSSVVSGLMDLIKSEEKEILTVEDIERLVEKTTEENIWEFVDALSEQNRKEALGIVEGLLKESQDFVLIVGMIARQLRILAMVKECQDKGKSYAEITSQLRLHPFVVRKAVNHSRNFSFSQLRKLYTKLLKTDLVVKEGRFDGKLALDLLIAAL